MYRAALYKSFPLMAFSLMLAFSSCFMGNARDRYTDLSTAGFLSGDCYQSILEFPPDGDTHGLVKGRESAIKKAKSAEIINWLVLDKLVEYSIDRSLSSSGPDALKKTADLNALKAVLRERLQPFLSYGKVEYTFFREDNTAVAVHRIYRKGLQERIDGIDMAVETGK